MNKDEILRQVEEDSLFGIVSTDPIGGPLKGEQDLDELVHQQPNESDELTVNEKDEDELAHEVPVASMPDFTKNMDEDDIVHGN